MQLSDFFKTSALACVLVILMGCKQQPLTRMYLFQHPNVLQKQFVDCGSSTSADCVLIKNTAQEYVVMNTQRQEDPELFGKMILQAQQELGKKQVELGNLKNQLKIHPDDTQLKNKMTSLQNEYSAQSQRVDILLAVVASTSPE